METKTFTIKDFTFGDGTPRIVVPLIGRTGEEIFMNSHTIKNELDKLDAEFADTPEYKVAVIEWRADYYGNAGEPENVFNILRHLRQTFPDKVVLFTFRSEEQGGELRHDRLQQRMSEVMRNVISSGLIDMVDVEFTVGNYNIARATMGCHQAGIKAVMSYHDFDKTPHDAEIEEKLRQMEVLGGDLLKIAAMPKTVFDADRMMELNQKMVVERSKPIALISMGEKGVKTRIRGKESGCALTFASIAGLGSAPGQLDVRELIKQMKKEHF